MFVTGYNDDMSNIDLNSPPSTTASGSRLWNFPHSPGRSVVVQHMPVGALTHDPDRPSWRVSLVIQFHEADIRRCDSAEEAQRFAEMLFGPPARDRTAEMWARRQSTAFGKGYKRLPKHLKKDAA